MIYSRPQTSTFISLLIFIFLSYALLAMQVMVVVFDPRPGWFNYLIVIILTPTALFVSYRVIFRYKIISMEDQVIKLRYPLLNANRHYSFKEVIYWQESVVETGKVTRYKELELKFSDGRTIQMGYREYTEYDKMVKYLGQKIPQLKRIAQ